MERLNKPKADGRLGPRNDATDWRRKRSDFAALLPVFGILMFATPFLSTLDWGGAPTIFDIATYIFVLWALFIAASFTFARAITPKTDNPSPFPKHHETKSADLAQPDLERPDLARYDVKLDDKG